MKWKNISQAQPKLGEIIVIAIKGCDIGDCGDMEHGDYHYSFTVAQNKVDENIYNNLQYPFAKPDYWWVYAKDFQFPDQPERLSEKTSKEDAIV